MPKSSDTDSEYITPGEATKIAYLSTKQLTRLADDGKVRFVRPGKHRRYNRADILALLTSPATPTAPAVDNSPQESTVGASSLSEVGS